MANDLKATAFNFYVFQFLTVCLLMSSSIIFNDLSLIEISEPKSVVYKLWVANFNILDLAFLLFFCFLIFTSIIQNSVSKLNISIYYFIFLIINIAGFLLLLSNNFSLTVYSDSIIYAFRFFIFLITADICLNSSNRIQKWLKTIIITSIPLALISLVMYFLFSYSTSMAGRVNTLGMGVNITSDFFTFIFILSFFYYSNEEKKIGYILIMGLSLLVILLTGSRRALVIIIFVLGVYKFNHLSRNKRIHFILILLVTLPLLYLVLPFLLGFFAEATGFSTLQRLNESLKISETATSIENIDGRYIMYLNSIFVFLEYPYGLGNSDWLIQDSLSMFGTGSHTHNFLIQSYFKYGISSILLLFPIFAVLKGIIKKTTMGYLFIGILITQSTGHAFWNIKYLFLVSVFFVILLKELHTQNETIND